MLRRARQQGLTLLEVLIALSIFSTIGVASYRVLDSTMAGSRVHERSSETLASLQRAVIVMDQDMQQIVPRNTRTPGDKPLHYLSVGNEDYPLQFTRGGRSNPLQMPRSALQRVAYDIGLHPQADDRDSRHYRDQTRYLRRHVWQSLDAIDSTEPLSQVLLANADKLVITVISEKGRHINWPLEEKDKKKPTRPIALELSWLLSSGDDQSGFARNDEGNRLLRFYALNAP